MIGESSQKQTVKKKNILEESINVSDGKKEFSEEFSLGYIPPEQEEFADDIKDIYEEKKVNWQGVELSKKMSSNKIWGILTVKLREKNYLTLHTDCGEIREIVRENDHLIATVYEEYLFNILNDTENFEKILFELKQIDDKITLEFIHKKKGRDKVKENLQLIKNLFGDKLQVE